MLRRTDTRTKRQPQDGKLLPNWEGPYRVIDLNGKVAHKLEALDGKVLLRK